MKASSNFIVVALVSVISFVPIEAVEVYRADRNGKPSWQETSQMRDRSVVPTPSFHDKVDDYRRRSKIPVPDVKAYRTRSNIPVPVATNYRSHSHDIPRPSHQDIIKDYIRRSGIPVPQLANKIDIKIPIRRAANRRYFSNQKKNIINRILFTMPFGAQFPIYFASRPRKGTNKKSDVAVPAPRYRIPAVHRLQTWGLPVNYNSLSNKKYLVPYMEQQAIARQHIIPVQGDTIQGRSRGYYSPRSFFTSRLLSNRHTIPLYQKNRSYTAPRSQYFLNRTTRSSDKKLKDKEQSRKAVINRERL